MALVRILVDGYSMLHSCREIAPGTPRYSAAARDELIHWLTQYRDATGTPVTVVFDAAKAPPGIPKTPSTPEMEILFSRAGQTADDVIERVCHRFLEYGEILVVTDDFAERETILSLGGMVSSCGSFLQTIQTTLNEFDRELKRINRRQIEQFKKPRS